MVEFLTSMHEPLFAKPDKQVQKKMMNSTSMFFETLSQTVDPDGTIFLYACLQAADPLKEGHDNMLSYVSRLVSPIQVLGATVKIQNVLIQMPEDASQDLSIGAHCHAHDLATHGDDLRRTQALMSTGVMRPPRCGSLVFIVPDGSQIGWGLGETENSAVTEICQGWLMSQQRCPADKMLACKDRNRAMRQEASWILASLVDADSDVLAEKQIPQLKSKMWCSVRMEVLNFSDWFHKLLTPACYR
mmetsp:Transcript_78132/g.154871  ORF Transcript_78132/g.154871 Transcript_78132/m.154871 type:complete len:245 (-) Transcript_78132:33-767(-)